MKSIRTKILSVNIIAILMITFIVGGMGIYTASELAAKESEIALKLMCDTKKEEADRVFHSIEQSVHIMLNQAVVELHEHGQNGVDEDYVEHMGELFSNVAENTQGAVAYYLRYNPEIAGPLAGFFWSKESGESDFCEYPCTDLYAYEEDDNEHVGWYYIPVNAGKEIWLEPSQNRNNHILMCSFVTPYFDNGELIGVIGMDVDIAEIMESINRTNVYKSGYVYLKDSEDNVVYHKTYKTGEELPEKDTGELEYEVLLENGLILVVNVSRQEVFHTRNELIRHIVLFAVFAVLIFGIISVGITNRITNPLTALAKVVKDVESGIYDVKLETDRQDEIGILSRNFLNTLQYLKKYNMHITSLAYKDSLTGTRNATAYKEAVKTLESRMEQEHPSFAVVVFDLNGLKQVNDQYGHAAGNALIIGSARLVCSVFKNSPVFRIGGDEFLSILQGEDYEKRDELLETLEADMNKSHVESQEHDFVISIAKGMAVYQPDQDESYMQVFKRADKAMYENKQEMKRAMKEKENRNKQG